MAQPRIKVAVLDTTPVVILGMQAILTTDIDVEYAGGYTDVNEMINHLGSLPVDVLIVEIYPNENAEQFIGMLRKSLTHTNILVFSLSDIYARAALRQGVSGYILKASSGEEILRAIHAVYHGQQYLDSTIRGRIIQKLLFKTKHPGNDAKLTRREKEILQLIASNYNSVEISRKLFISRKTVDNHRANMLLKLKVKNAASLIKKAIELGLLEV